MNSSISRTGTLAFRAALGLAVGSLFAETALAQRFDPPPLPSESSSEHHPGKVVWVELVTPDLAAAERFYSGLFGWTFRDLSNARASYAVASLDGEAIAGLVEHALPADERRQPAWLTFIAVRDVDATERAALAQGGAVVVQPRTYPSRGRQAVFSDPQGAVFAVLASRTGDPPDYLAPPGAWIWSTVLARDADTDAGFYQKVFGYDVFDLEGEDGREHAILSTDNYARAGVNTLPADSARRHPHWINFVRVPDATAAADKAVALGGRVLVAPRVDRHGGKLAVLADPSGAPIGVMEWTLSDSKEEPK